MRLSEVIAALETAYPPAFAQDWDSVGLVCGDPDESVESVTVAVDATAAVVDTVAPRGLCLPTIHSCSEVWIPSPRARPRAR